MPHGWFLAGGPVSRKTGGTFFTNSQKKHWRKHYAPYFRTLVSGRRVHYIWSPVKT